MKKDTLEFVAAEEAFSAAMSVFERVKTDWIAAGKPSRFPALDAAVENWTTRRMEHVRVMRVISSTEVAS
jgi:hypothetical protein